MGDRNGGRLHRGLPADDGDATLRGLIGAGRSRIPPVTAMRARDAARPTDADAAAAEQELVIRHARPRPEEAQTLPFGAKQARSRRGAAARNTGKGSPVPRDGGAQGSGDADGDGSTRDRS